MGARGRLIRDLHQYMLQADDGAQLQLLKRVSSWIRLTGVKFEITSTCSRTSSAALRKGVSVSYRCSDVSRRHVQTELVFTIRKNSRQPEAT